VIRGPISYTIEEMDWGRAIMVAGERDGIRNAVGFEVYSANTNHLKLIAIAKRQLREWFDTL
jgi:hypothetical protein